MRRNITLAYLILVVAQVLICNYFHVTQYVMLSILPAMILCLPPKCGTTASLLIAFVTGLAVDFLADGVPGLNAMALLPVAMLRLPVIRFVFGEDVFESGGFSLRRNGIAKVSFAVILVQALFLLLYILADGAGTRPFWFNISRLGASLLAGYLLSLLIVDILSPDNRDL